MIYYIIFISLAIMVFAIEVVKIKQLIKIQNVLYFVFSTLLILFAGLRVNTGYDYQSYERIFNTIASWQWSDLLSEKVLAISEPGYVMLNYFFRNLGFQSLIFVIAFFSIGLKVLYINKYCQQKWIALFVYYGMYMCSYDMGIVRQGMSIALCIWALKKYSEKRYKSFVGLVIFASLFHMTAILFFVIPIASKIKRNQYGMLLIGGVMFSRLWYNIILFLPRSYLLDRVLYRITPSGDVVSDIYLSVIKRCLLLVIFLLIIDWKMVEQELGDLPDLQLNIFFMSIVLALVMSHVPIMGGRGTAVFQFVQVFIFPYMLNIRYYKDVIINKKVLLVTCYGFTIVWTLYNLTKLLNSGVYIPYLHV